MVIGIIVVCTLLIGGSVIFTHKWHNPIEKDAAAVIEKETGVDVDKILPADKK